MRFYVLLILIVLCTWSCETKKRRRQNRRNGSNKDLDVGFGLTPSDQAEIPSRSDSKMLSLGENENRRRRKSNSKRNRNKNKASQKNRRKKQNSQRSRSREVLDLLEERRKETLRNTMRHMFGFDHMDTPRVSNEPELDVENLGSKNRQESRESLSRTLFSSLRHKSPSRNRLLPNPPDFMLELYRTYSEDKSLMLVKSQSQGDTVRSFFSVAGDSPDQLRNKGKPMIILPYVKSSRTTQTAGSGGDALRPTQIRVFAFNVTSIPVTETIVGAELRLNGLRNQAVEQRSNGNDSHREWTAVLAVYKVSEAEENQTRNVYRRLSELVTIRPNSSFSWVNPDVARLSTLARQPGCLLIVKFNHFEPNRIMRRRRSATRSTPNHSELDALSSRDSSPFLPSYFVVLSDRSKRNSGDRQRISRSLTPILIVYCNDTTADVAPAVTPLSSNDILTTLQSLNVSTNLKRFRRSSGSALLGESPVTTSDRNENELPGESGRQTAVSRSFSPTHDNDQTELHDNGRSDRRVIQSLKDRKSMSRKRKNKKRKCGRRCRKRCRKGKKSRKCRKGGSVTAEPSLNRAQQTCGRKSLNVDFGDMGWENWIISPKSFDAYYCSGLCQFDTMKKASPSNHAIIQAFIKAFEINAEVPAPCCVPDKLMSLSVLYYDKDDNVVLKVFPNMSVKSCACR